jgi:hypothetical protein
VRAFIWLVIIGVILVPGGLFWARHETSRHWVRGLYVSSAGVSFVALSLLLAAAKRLVAKRLWLAVGALFSGVTAVAARCALLFFYAPPTRGPAPIMLWVIATRALHVVCGVAALLLGAAVAWSALNTADKDKKKTRVHLNLTLGAVALTAGLYGLAPLVRLAGLGVDIWSFILLLLLSMLAFVVAAIIDHRSKRKTD